MNESFLKSEHVKCIKSVIVHENWVSCIDISADNQYLLSASYDKTVKLWSLKNYECIKSV